MSNAAQLQEAIEATDYDTLHAAERAASKEMDKMARPEYLASAVHDFMDSLRDRATTTDWGVHKAWSWAAGRHQKRFWTALARNKDFPRWTKKAIEDGHKNPIIPTPDEIALAKKRADEMKAKRKAFLHDVLVPAQKALEKAKKTRSKEHKRKKEFLSGAALCQLCFRGFVYDRSGDLVKHGWYESGQRRKGQYGNAWHTGQCPGSNHLPLQVDVKLTRGHLAQLKLIVRALNAAVRDRVGTEAELSGNAKYRRAISAIGGHLHSMGKKMSQDEIDKKVPLMLKDALGAFQHEATFVDRVVKTWKRNDEWVEKTGWPSHK